jgi:hypothetical protein
MSLHILGYLVEACIEIWRCLKNQDLGNLFWEIIELVTKILHNKKKRKKKADVNCLTVLTTFFVIKCVHCQQN